MWSFIETVAGRPRLCFGKDPVQHAQMLNFEFFFFECDEWSFEASTQAAPFTHAVLHHRSGLLSADARGCGCVNLHHHNFFITRSPIPWSMVMSLAALS